MGQCIGSAGLRADPDQHCVTYTVGLFVAGLRGQGLGQEITRLVVSWAFGVLDAHRIELEVLASNSGAINCYLACGFRQEGIRREAGLYPDGWKDFLLMGLLQSEYLSQAKTAARRDPVMRSPLNSCGFRRPSRLGIHVQPTVVEAAPDTLRYRILHLLAWLAMHARSRVLPRRRLAMDPRRSEMLGAPLRPTSAPELTSSPDE